MAKDSKTRALDRRGYLKLVGGAGVTVSLAGCTGGGGGDGGDGDDGGDGGDMTTTQEASSDAIVLGQPGALTGKWDFLQTSVSAMADLVVEDINAAGGPLDRELTISRRDTAVDPTQARTVFKQLVNVDGASVINGGFSSTLIPIWDFLQETQVPVITSWPGTRFLDDKGGDNGTPEDISDDEWVWRTIISDSVHTAGGALKAAEFGNRVGVIHGTSEGETSWADAFIDAVGVIDDLELVKRVEVEEGKNSYQTEINRLFQEDFDVWAMALALEDAVTMIKNWDQGGYGKPVVGEDTLSNPDFYKALGDVLEGKTVTVAKPGLAGPSNEAISQKFAEKYPDEDLHPWATAEYEAVNIAALAIHRAGSADPKEVQKNIGPVARPPGKEVTTFAEGKEALDAGEEINFQGAVTTADFTGKGEVVGPTQILQVKPTESTVLDVIEAEEIEEILLDPSYGQ